MTTSPPELSPEEFGFDIIHPPVHDAALISKLAFLKTEVISPKCRDLARVALKRCWSVVETPYLKSAATAAGLRQEGSNNACRKSGTALASASMRRMERPTIVDVAEAAGVGASTVSRYVRGAKSVSSRVSTRIEAAIAQLGYQPNVLARGLRVGHTRVIGVLFPHVANMFYANALGAIETEAHRQGFTVLLLTHNEDRQLQETQLSTLKRFQCDGIILIAAAETDAVKVQEILGSTALVALDRPLGKIWDSVTLQNYKAARTITEHLVRHGHRYIVAITAPYRIDTLIQRQKGYRDALRHAGLNARVVALREPEQLRRELLHLFESGHSPALLSLSHSVTVAALLGLRESGFSLRSMAFAAVDDLEFATLLDPPLTTLAQPAEQLALLALERLLLRMRGGDSEVSHLRLPGKLVIRESCGCVGTPRRSRQAAVAAD